MAKKTYFVDIRDSIGGSWEIKAENEDEAAKIAGKRLMDGDMTWQATDIGSAEILSVEEICRVTGEPGHEGWPLPNKDQVCLDCGEVS